MKGCDYISKLLLSAGVTHVFGYQGGAVTPLIDAFARAGLKYVQCRHEQASGFAADAYARLTGKCGVVVVTNGPGATNVITAVANAHLDSVPVLFITGQVNVSDMKTENVRQNGFQEIDTVSMAKPVTKYAARIMEKSVLRNEFSKAFRIACSGRKGAVLIDLPMNLLFEDIPDIMPSQEPEVGTELDDETAQTVAKMLKRAERPVIVAGGGIRSAGAEKELAAFVRKTKIPVVRTLMGYDIYTQTDAGFSGNYGLPCANNALYHADLILALGTRFAKRQIGKNIKDYAPAAKIVHIDIDPAEFGHVVRPDIAVYGDLTDFLKKMNRLLIKPDLKKWTAQINKWKKERFSSKPVDIVRRISRSAPSNCVVTTDVGQNQMWVAQGWQLKNGQRFLTSGGLGCMGFSLPAAIGAAFAKKRNIIAFTGDGGLQMNLQELQTVAERKLPIKLFVFNNNSLGMIAEGQMKYHDSRFVGTKTGYSCPDLKKTASAFGLDYVRFNGCDLEKTLKSNKPVLIEIPLKDKVTRAFTRLDSEYSQKKIFFDLDGTLIDAGERLYSLFQFLVPQSKLTYGEYWDLKRHKNTHAMILADRFGYDGSKIHDFEKRWLELIETKEYLDKDTVYPDVIETLEKLKRKYALYLVTARQSVKNTVAELKRLNLFDLFDDVLITEHKSTKEDLIRQCVSQLSSDDIMVGDTGKDIQAGKALGVQTIAVSSGFLAAEVLREYEPDRQIKNIEEVRKNVGQFC